MFRIFNDFLRRVIPPTVYSFVVLTVIAINMLFIGGKRRNFGIFVSEFYRTFNGTSLFELNMVGDTYSSFANILMPFLASLICYCNNSYQMAMFMAGALIMISSLLTSLVTNPGMLFLTHSVIHGTGSGLILACCGLVVGDYFNKSHKLHVLASSLASSGAYGVLILTPIFAHMVEVYGWRETFIIIGVMFLIICISGSIVFIPVTEQYEEIGETGKKKVSSWKFCSWDHVKNNKQTLLYLIDRLLGGIILFGVMMNLTQYSRWSNNSSMESSSMINVYLGIGECIMFTITMLLGDKFRGKLPLVPLTGVLLSFIFLLAMRYSVHKPTFTNILTVFLGGAIGLCNCVLYAASSEAMNIDGSISLPMSKMSSAIGALISPFFSGMIIDHFNYEALFNSLIIITSIRFVLLLIVNIMYFNFRKRMLKEDEEVQMLKVQEDKNQNEEIEQNPLDERSKLTENNLDKFINYERTSNDHEGGQITHKRMERF